MPETASYSVQAAVAGTTYVRTSSVSGTNVERATPSVPAAKPGVLTTRTDNDTGTFTMDAGHGFSTSDAVDVFWAGGSRRAMTATVTGNSVVLDGGSGDTLPAAATAVTAMKPVEVAFGVDATATGVAVVAACPVSGWVVFRDAADAVLLAARVPAGVNAYVWVTGMGSNPLAGAAVGNVLVSHADATQAQTVTAAVVF